MTQPAASHHAADAVGPVTQAPYESMRETLYLMASPANRRRISRSIEQLNEGRGQVHELTDADEDDV
jgi:antitoxin YefM